MPSAPATRAEIQRAIEAVVEAGLAPRSVEVRPNGTVYVAISPTAARKKEPVVVELASRHIPKELREFIFVREAYQCGYCGDDDGPFHIDHILPRSRGGQNTPNNLILACATCNQSKGDLTPEEWLGEQ